MRSPHDAQSAPLLGRFDIVETRIVLAGRVLEFLRPRSADDLLDEEEFERDERIPYWAEIWPSARVLAERTVREPGSGQAMSGAGVRRGDGLPGGARGRFRDHGNRLLRRCPGVYPLERCSQ